MTNYVDNSEWPTDHQWRDEYGDVPEHVKETQNEGNYLATKLAAAYIAYMKRGEYTAEEYAMLEKQIQKQKQFIEDILNDKLTQQEFETMTGIESSGYVEA